MGNGASVDHGAKAHLHHKIKHEIPQCAICLAAMTENMSSLKCGHTYHTQCLLKSMEYSSHCPNCRTYNTPVAIRKVHIPFEVIACDNSNEVAELHKIIEGYKQQVHSMSNGSNLIENLKSSIRDLTNQLNECREALRLEKEEVLAHKNKLAGYVQREEGHIAEIFDLRQQNENLKKLHDVESHTQTRFPLITQASTTAKGKSNEEMYLLKQKVATGLCPVVNHTHCSHSAKNSQPPHRKRILICPMKSEDLVESLQESRKNANTSFRRITRDEAAQLFHHTNDTRRNRNLPLEV